MSSLAEEMKALYQELMDDQEAADGEFIAVSSEKTSFRIKQRGGRTERLEEMDEPFIAD